MREVAIRIWDDIDHHEDGTKTEADVTVTIGLDGHWKELDLTAEHDAALRGQIEAWMAAGHDPESPPLPNDPQRANRASPDFAYGRELRAFAKAAGMRFRTDTGKYYYSVKLRRAFTEWVEAGKPPLPEPGGQSG